MAPWFVLGDMKRETDQSLPVELMEVADRLRDERVAPSALELDRLKLRIPGLAQRRSSRKESFMRSRIAITSMLVLGAFVSAGGVGLAVTGTSGSGSASKAQYGTPTTPAPAAVVSPATETNTTPAPSDDVLGSNAGQSPSTGVAGEVVRQRVVESSRLPFTGYAAIPILLLGLALLTTGLVTRRRVRSDAERH